MKQILIPVRTDCLNTKEDVLYAMVNRLEEMEGKGYHVPDIRQKTVDVKLKEGAGLYTFIQGCLP